jgi:hypothetical protein
MRADRPSNGATTARLTTRGGQANVRFVRIGCSTATVSQLDRDVLGAHRCDRVVEEAFEESRKRVVDATVVACEQRDAETLTHA